MLRREVAFRSFCHTSGKFKTDIPVSFDKVMQLVASGMSHPDRSNASSL